MSGRSTVSADAEQRRLLGELAQSRDRGEADRARAILLTLSGWSGPRIAEAFGVAENTVRLWRMAFMREGVAALRTSPLGDRRRSKPSAHLKWQRRSCRCRWRIGRTGRCRG